MSDSMNINTKVTITKHSSSDSNGGHSQKEPAAEVTVEVLLQDVKISYKFPCKHSSLINARRAALQDMAYWADLIYRNGVINSFDFPKIVLNGKNEATESAVVTIKPRSNVISPFVITLTDADDTEQAFHAAVHLLTKMFEMMPAKLRAAATP